MPKIKLREFKGKSIKKLDKKVISASKFKENLIDIKEKNNESSVAEYGSNKIDNAYGRITQKVINGVKRVGDKSVVDTANNIIKTKNKIKLYKEKLAKNKSRKALKKGNKVAIKGTKRVIKGSNKIAKETVKAPKRIINNIKRFVKTTKHVIKITIQAIKAVVTGTKAIITALVAGGWILVVIIIVICLIAFLLNSVFGIFLSNENTGDKMMNSVIEELNNELSEKITNIQNENPHDDYVLNLNRTDWKYILSVYTVIVSNGENATDVITINDYKTNILKDVFWKMNVITYNVQDEVDETGASKRVLYINIDGKTVNDMIVEYNLNPIQQKQMNELLSDKYASMWSNVVYGGGIGNSNVVDIALSQVETLAENLTGDGMVLILG